ncbi:MAG: shikimate kinase [Succiniclasticum sp.]|nr:shikimate kinase [Succiniclasticum sp.]
MKNIVLIGMPGSGKSTLGRYLAELLERDFIDADQEIEKASGKTIPALFAVSETCFRDWETAVVRKLSRTENKVLAMGGGVVLRKENIACLKENGVVIFIDRSPGDIIRDVNAAIRPLLAAGKERIYELYIQRESLYREAADLTVTNKGTLKDVLVRLLDAAKNNT